MGNWLDEQTRETIQSSITELHALEMAEQGMCEGNTYEAICETTQADVCQGGD